MSEWTFMQIKDGYAVLSMKGVLIGDSAPFDDYKAAFAEYIRKCDKKPKIIIDLSQVTYINATAIEDLVTMHTTVSRLGGKILLTGINKNINNIFVLTRLTIVFEVVDSLDEAEKQMRRV